MKEILIGLLVTLALFSLTVADEFELIEYEEARTSDVSIISALAVGPIGGGARIYMLHSDVTRDILVYRQNLTRIFSFGEAELNAGDYVFDFPVALAVDADDNTYVLGSRMWHDEDGMRGGAYNIIRKFNRGGEFVDEWVETRTRQLGRYPDINMASIAVDSSRRDEILVYLTDPTARSIFKYDSTGNPIDVYEFASKPSFIEVDRDGNIYVIQEGDNRWHLIKYNRDGFEEIVRWPVRLSDLRGLCIDGSGNVYLQYPKFIFKYSPEGTLLAKIFVRDSSFYYSGIEYVPGSISSLSPDPEFITSTGRVRRIKRKKIITTTRPLHEQIRAPSITTTTRPIHEQIRAPSITTTTRPIHEQIRAPSITTTTMKTMFKAIPTATTTTTRGIYRPTTITTMPYKK